MSDEDKLDEIYIRINIEDAFQILKLNGMLQVVAYIAEKDSVLHAIIECMTEESEEVRLNIQKQLSKSPDD